MACPIDLVGAVGAGFMGSGIAESTARAGFYVVVHEPEAAPLPVVTASRSQWRTRHARVTSSLASYPARSIFSS